MKYPDLTQAHLETIAGGSSASNCLKSIGLGAAGGAVKGGLAGTAFGVGLGNVAGAFLGAHIGAVGGAAVCIGGLLYDHR